MVRSLKNIKTRGREKPFLVADIESRNWIEFVVIGLYDGKKFLPFLTLDGFLEYLFKNYDEIDVFFHFGGVFDFIFLIKEILRTNKFKIGEIIPRGSGILYFDVFSRGRRITFRDSSALLPFSLKSLTNNFGVDSIKQEWDHSKTTGPTRELLHYLEFDCKGLFEVLQKFYSWPIIKKAGTAYTIAGQSMKVLQTFLKKPVYGLNPNIDEAIRPSYTGGRVEIFKPFFQSKTKTLKCYDVNSLYPTVMKKHRYPSAFKYEVTEYEKGSFGIYKCDVVCPDNLYIPFLGATNSDGKYIFPVGKFSGMYTSVEIEYAKKLGYKFRINHGYVFWDGGFIFKEYVDELYSIREKAEKNSVDSVIAKLLLNSCYGRFGLNLNKENIVFDDGSEGLNPIREIKVGNNTYRLALKEMKLETFNNVAIAAFVTAYARIHMHCIYKSCGKDLYYTDTDSLFTTKNLSIGMGLGSLKLEYEVQSACFLLPKTYVAQGVSKKVVMKGFDSKKIQHFTVDDFYACLEGELKLKVNQDGKFAKLKTALKHPDILHMTKPNTKEIRSVYDKRVIYKNKRGEYESQPIRISPS